MQHRFFTKNSKMSLDSPIAVFLTNEIFLGQIDFTNSTPLISSKLLDSITIMQLVAFLEETYNIEFAAHEISEEYMDTISSIVTLIDGKQHTKADH